MDSKKKQTYLIYGITEYIEDQCEVTCKSAWHIMRHTCPYTIISDNYSHILLVMENNLILVKDADDNHEKNDPTYITTYFEKKANGEWFPKLHEFHCEFCGQTTNCDRVEYHDDLQDNLKYCMMWEATKPEVTNSTKCKYMCRTHTFQNNGRLGIGNHIIPNECVVKLVRKIFLNPTGLNYVGFRANYQPYKGDH